MHPRRVLHHLLGGAWLRPRFWRRVREKLSTRERMNVYVASTRPAVLVTPHGYPVRPLLRRLRGRPVHLAFQLHWAVSWIEAARALVREHEALRRDFPGLEVSYLANAEKEAGFFRELGCEAVFCNHNCFLDETIFTHEPAEAKAWDVFYDAQIAPYKRQELAAEIDSLVLVGLRTSFHFDEAYVRRIQELLPRATWLNNPLVPAMKVLTAHEIASIIRRSRCGLCLSAVEGAMFASAQYLLCGVPVVTTPSEGGRDAFFDERWVEWVEPNPRAVRDGVRRVIARAPGPDVIRAGTLRLFQEHRDRFAAHVDNVVRRLGGTTPERPRRYPHKLVAWREASAIAAQVRAADQPAA